MDLGGVNHRTFLGIVEDEKGEGELIKCKGRFSGFFPEGIDGVKNFWMLNEAFF